MPRYQITDEQTGRTLLVEGDSAPDDADIEFLFSQIDQPDTPEASPALPTAQPAPTVEKTEEPSLVSKAIASVIGGPSKAIFAPELGAGTIEQVRLGLIGAAPAVSRDLNRALAMVTDPQLGAGKLAPFLQAEVPGFMKSMGAVSEQFQGAADIAGEYAEAVETVGQATKGPDIARTIATSAGSLAPSLAAAPAGLWAMAVAGGIQQMGGTYGQSRQTRLEGARTPEEIQSAEKAAALDGIAAGLITTLVTRGFGATGVDVISKLTGKAAAQTASKAIAQQGSRAAVVELLKQSGLEASEEMVDQMFQTILQKLRYSPDLTFHEAARQVLEAGLGGAILSSFVNVPQAAATITQTTQENASQDRTTEEVYGDVRQQPEQVQEAVPAQEGGAGVQPQAQEEVTENDNPKSLETKGVSQQEIFSKTGMWKAPGGFWVPDDASVEIPDTFVQTWFEGVASQNMKATKGYTLDEIAGENHPLFMKYPWLKDMKFYVDMQSPSAGGGYLPVDVYHDRKGSVHIKIPTKAIFDKAQGKVQWVHRTVDVDPSKEIGEGKYTINDENPSILLSRILNHEITHAVQDRLNLPEGGSPLDYFFDQNLKLDLEGKRQESFDYYKRLAGESLARLSEVRSKMSQTEKINEPPWVTFQKMLESEGIIKSGESWEDVLVVKQHGKIISKSKPKAQEEVAVEPEEDVLESRIVSEEEAPDFEAITEDEAQDYFERRFGTIEEGEPSEFAEFAFGRTGRFTFPDYDPFKQWMGARYAERDLEGMKLAFAEASNKMKARWIKDVLKGADPHLKNWIYHMATGTDLSTDTDPPVTRTTRRPMPGEPEPTPGAQPPPGPAPTGTPGAPPPGAPPGPPSPRTNVPGHRPFNITAMVQLLRTQNKFPTVNKRLTKAYGRYMTAAQQVELKSRLLWDQALASRVLGHEIGHWIDLAIEATGKGKKFAERLKPMFDFKNNIAQARHLTNQAKELSSQWRGPFSPGDRYRNKSSELFADFISSMLNDPNWVNQNFPDLFDAFQDLRDAKPAFKHAYRELETWLQGDTMAAELIEQDKEAVMRTHDILFADRKAEKASIKNRLLGAFTTVWNRAFEMEGKPRLIGKSLTEKLEFSYTWGANQMSVWFDDYVKSVQPNIDKISNDPIEAQAALLTYTKARRIIGERRAGGIWIEQNPEEARSLLKAIIKLDPALSGKYNQAVEDAQPDGIYDLSAVILREIHDLGETFVNRVISEIDKMDLGVDGDSMMVAFNVRGKLLNPQGVTPETAQQELDELSNRLGPQRYQALETAANNLRGLLFDVQRRMHDAGLISDKMWNELIVPNQDNYVPFAVLDYFEGSVGAGIMPQEGTTKDVADVSAATQLKVVSSLGWLQRQRQAMVLRDIWTQAGNAMPLGQRLKRSSEIKDIRRAHKHDSTSRIVIWDNGQPHVMELTGDPGKTLESATSLPEFYDHIKWFQEASQFSHRVMALFTQWNPAFMAWRNPVRGTRTAYLKVGARALAKQIGPKRTKELMRLAYNYAEAATGKAMLPEVRALVESQALPAPHLAYGEVRDLSSARELMARGALPVFVAQRLRHEVPQEAGPVRTGVRKADAFADKMFTAYEAFEKIYNFQAALEAGHDVETAQGVARRAGIVNPGVSGKWSSLMEIFYPWTRIRLQGLRVTYQMLRDPRFRKGYAARFGLTEAVPRMAKAAIAAGIVSGAIKWLLLGDDDDENDSVVAEVFRRISPYKMALDDLVPVMLYDARTGDHIPFWEFKEGSKIPSRRFKKGSEIPDHYEVISWRLPTSEEGITWGTFLYHNLSSAPGLREQIGKPDKGWLATMGDWAGDYLVPGLSPAITTTVNTTKMIATGENPQDPYTMHPSANKQMFDAGGMERAQAIAGYVMNNSGGPGVLAGIMAANFGLMDERALNAFSQRLASDKESWIQKIPFSSTMFSFDNYAKYRTERLSQVEEEQLRAGAKLIMPPRVRSMYDFYYKNVRRRDKLSDNDLEQFEVASAWIRNVWGTLTIDGKPNSNSWYSKAAAATKGSRQAKATFKRDIEAVSEEYVAEFETIRSSR
jgi:hypothetical protein